MGIRSFQLRQAQIKTCKKASKKANDLMRETFIRNSVNWKNKFSEKLSKMSLPNRFIMRMSWNPFQGDHHVQSGLGMDLNDNEADMLGVGTVVPQGKIDEIVMSAFYQTIIDDPEIFIKALVEDALTNPQSFYESETIE